MGSLAHRARVEWGEATCGSPLQAGAQAPGDETTLRRGFYGGQGHGTHEWGPIDIAGCWTKAMGEIDAWIAKDNTHEQDGLSGTLIGLVGIEKLTSTGSDCLGITDMGLMPVNEADNPELEEAGPDSDSDSDSE